MTILPYSWFGLWKNPLFAEREDEVWSLRWLNMAEHFALTLVNEVVYQSLSFESQGWKNNSVMSKSSLWYSCAIKEPCCYPKINGQDKPVKQPQLSVKEIVLQVGNTVCWPDWGLGPTDQLDMLLTVKSYWLLPRAHFCEIGAVHHWPNSWFTNTSVTNPKYHLHRWKLQWWECCLGQMANAYGCWHHLTGHPAEVSTHFSILQVLKLFVRADHSFLLNGSAIPEASSSTSGSPEDNRDDECWSTGLPPAM